jgi:hypothetical protein
MKEKIRNVLRSNLHTTSKHATDNLSNMEEEGAKQPTPDQ